MATCVPRCSPLPALALPLIAALVGGITIAVAQAPDDSSAIIDASPSSAVASFEPVADEPVCGPVDEPADEPTDDPTDEPLDDPIERTDLDPAVRARGADVWSMCQGCHFEPNLVFPPDVVWLDQLETTTCFTKSESMPIPADEQRTLLRQFLESTAVSSTPILTPGDDPQGDGGSGAIRLPEVKSWVVLRRTNPVDSDSGESQPELIRCYWPAGEESGVVRVPTGEYSITFYGTTRTLGSDTWTFNASGATDESVVAAPGEIATVSLGFRARCDPDVALWRDGIDLSVNTLVSDQFGLTLSKNGVRPPIQWRLLHRDVEIADGVLAYG